MGENKIMTELPQEYKEGIFLEFAIKISKTIMNSVNCSGIEASCPFFISYHEVFQRINDKGAYV